MPWTVKDVDRHKKGLTATQKKKWVKIANATLKDCLSKGGKDCDGKAIRVANSKFSEEKHMEIPKGALHLMEMDTNPHAFADKDGEGKKKLKMTIYSGKLITGHWYWGSLAIDLSGMQFPLSKYPILEEHMTSRKIAVTGKPIIDENGLHVDSDKTKFVTTEYSEEFQRLSAEGFPYQASVYAKPTSVERVEEGESAEVNGIKLKGPGHIWRKSIFQEGSVCVFGHDKQTQSSAFSRTELEEVTFDGDIVTTPAGGNVKPELQDGTKKLKKEVKKSMDLKELQEKHPELVKGIEDAAVKAVQDAADKQAKADAKKIADLETDNSAMSGKVLNLEKKEIIRSEKELKQRGEVIWNNALAASEIPDHLYDKIRPHVSYIKYVKDDVLDEAKFKEAIDAEIESWKKLGITETVLGGGYSGKTEIDSKTEKASKQAKDDDDTTDALLRLAGETVDKDKT